MIFVGVEFYMVHNIKRCSHRNYTVPVCAHAFFNSQRMCTMSMPNALMRSCPLPRASRKSNGNHPLGWYVCAHMCAAQKHRRCQTARNYMLLLPLSLRDPFRPASHSSGCGSVWLTLGPRRTNSISLSMRRRETCAHAGQNHQGHRAHAWVSDAKPGEF